MAKVHDEWKVLPHQEIEKLETNLWRVQGTVPGMSLKRVMTLVRLEDGRVVIHGATSLEEGAMAEIEGWGRPAVLLVPNSYHRLDAPAYLGRYPDLEVYCPKGSKSGVEEVVRVDGDYDAFGGDSTLDLEHLDGVRKVEGVLTVRSPGGTTLVFNDAIFNQPHGKGLGGFIFRYITDSTGGPKVTRLFRWLALKDKKALKAHFERLAATPDLKRIIVAHHRTITDRPADVLLEVAAKV
jgi:hypothetical protein